VWSHCSVSVFIKRLIAINLKPANKRPAELFEILTKQSTKKCEILSWAISQRQPQGSLSLNPHPTYCINSWRQNFSQIPNKNIVI
uniref:Uncharacterized protein n=1 Tax=Astyanax mexicanus TaxID=7994 RepID=A0A8B9KY69_ASTMX